MIRRLLAGLKRADVHPVLILVAGVVVAAFVGAAVLVWVGHSAAAAVLVGLAVLGLTFGVLFLQSVTLRRQAVRQRRLESRLADLEKLVSRAEWRSDQASRDIVATLRRRSMPRPVEGSGSPADGWWRPGQQALQSQIARERPEGERDLERFLIELLLRRHDGDG